MSSAFSYNARAIRTDFIASSFLFWTTLILAWLSRAAPILLYTSLGYSNMSTLITLPQSGHAITWSRSESVFGNEGSALVVSGEGATAANPVSEAGVVGSSTVTASKTGASPSAPYREDVENSAESEGETAVSGIVSGLSSGVWSTKADFDPKIDSSI